MFSGLFWAGSYKKHQSIPQEKTYSMLLKIVSLKKVQLATLKKTLNTFYTNISTQPAITCSKFRDSRTRCEIC